MNSRTERKALVDNFFHALSEDGNVAAMRYTTADFVWWHPTHGNFTRADMSNIDAAIAQVFAGPISLTISNVLLDGDYGAIEAQMDVELVAGGRYTNNYLFLLKFFGNMICHLKEYNDTLYASQKMTPPS